MISRRHSNSMVVHIYAKAILDQVRVPRHIAADADVIGAPSQSKVVQHLIPTVARIHNANKTLGEKRLHHDKRCVHSPDIRCFVAHHRALKHTLGL